MAKRHTTTEERIFDPRVQKRVFLDGFRSNTRYFGRIPLKNAFSGRIPLENAFFWTDSAQKRVFLHQIGISSKIDKRNTVGLVTTRKIYS